MSTDRGDSSPRLTLAGHGPAVRAVPEDATAGQITGLRAELQIEALGIEHWPPYGSVAWLRLDIKDPRTYAATLEAAELHRRAEAERIRLDDLMDNDPATWWSEVTADARAEAAARVRAFTARRTAAEVRIARARAGRRPHELTATRGWPPIAIPGRPGEYLTYQETSE